MRGPGVSAGAVITASISLLDVAPTILDLLGLAPEPARQPLDETTRERRRALGYEADDGSPRGVPRR
jgi:arylsulfatase A-like enzyme